MVYFTCSFHFGYLKELNSRKGFIFTHFVYNRSFGQIRQKKLQNDPLDIKISMLVLVSQIVVFHFLHFEYKNEIWHILVEFIVYKVSLSSSRRFLFLFHFRSVTVFLVCFWISRPVKKKAWNAGKSQLFAGNFAQWFKWFFQ